ncbi:MAG: HEPN domain-containing protein [Thermoleophilia bacterium]
MDKASRAIASAELLLDAGDVDGACNRAYYAMFDAARAALIWSGAPVDLTVAKTHSGLISAFSLHVVKTGLLPVEFGKALNRAAEIRLVADYTGDEVTPDKARWVVDQALAFVEAVRRRLEPPR